MNRTSMMAALGLALVLPAAGAMAQGASVTGVSWSYFDIGAQYVNPDASALDSSVGPGIRGSGMINQNWHIFLGWNRGKLDGSVASGPVSASVDDNVDRYNIGIGYNLPIAANTDLFVRAGYERAGSANFRISNADGDFDGKLESTDGYSIEVGARGAFGRNWEAGASVRYIALDDPEVRIGDAPFDVGGLVDDDDHFALILQGQYKFNNGWGIIGEADIGSAYQALFIGARLSY